MRMPTKAAVAASTAVAAATVAVTVGRLAARRALRPATAREGGGGRVTLPAGFEEPLTVHARSAALPPQIALTRTLVAELPGSYGLVGTNVHAVVGHPLQEATHTAPADTVVRRLERVDRGAPATGDTVWLSPTVHEGDPRQALEVDHRDVRIDTERGTLPAWYVPANRRTWVVTAHGIGATRAHALNVLPLMQRLQLPVLMPAHRGDPGAPRDPDGAGRLSATAWRDLDAALHYAVEQGATRVLLYGWSTGATMALHTAAASEARDRIGGLILDSPVLDPDVTLRALATARGVPRGVVALAVRAAEGGAGTRPEQPLLAAEPRHLTVPTLLVHGPDDDIAPWELSRQFADSRPDLVTLRTIARARHAAMWNVNPETYEEGLSRFLMPLV